LRPAIGAASSEDRRNGIPIVAFRANFFALKCEPERHDAILIPAKVERNRTSRRGIAHGSTPLTSSTSLNGSTCRGSLPRLSHL
jgi:hypothetical protein